MRDAEGRQARTPRGLIREPIELVATDEEIMLRRSYNGIGKRGIGVGYPSQINLAFDAEQMRLAMIWKGKFADPAGVWRSQGHGRVRPLGKEIIRFAPGPELDDATNPWTPPKVDPKVKKESPPASEGRYRPPDHKFKGYYLDKLQRPTFMYRFGNIEVEDYPVDLRDAKSDSVYVRRVITFLSSEKRENLAFRVAADKKIMSEGRGQFLVGEKLRIRIDEKHQGKIKNAPDGKILFIPLSLSGKSKLVLEYRW